MEYQPSYNDSLRADILPSYSDSLMHYGVLGMKWGVRRYQNRDGSYTRQGKARRNTKSKISNSTKAKIAAGTVASVSLIAAGYYMSRHPEQVTKAMDTIDKNRTKTAKEFMDELNEKYSKYESLDEAYYDITHRDPIRDSVNAPRAALPAIGETSRDESISARLDKLGYRRDEAIEDYNIAVNSLNKGSRSERYDSRQRRLSEIEKRRKRAKELTNEYNKLNNQK